MSQPPTIPEDAWVALHGRLLALLPSLEQRWRERIPEPGWMTPVRWHVQTTVTDADQALTSAGNAIRGANGVSVSAKKTTGDRLKEAAAGFPRAPLRQFWTPAERACNDAWDQIRELVRVFPPLAEAFMNLVWGHDPGPPGAGEAFDFRMTVVGMGVQAALVSALREEGITLLGIEGATIPVGCASRAVSIVREAIHRPTFEREILVMLSGPVVDARSAFRIAELELCDLPFVVDVAYPTDDDLIRAFEDSAPSDAEWSGPSTTANCMLRVRYAAALADVYAADRAARRYLRDIVDLVRIVSDGPVDVLHVARHSLSGLRELSPRMATFDDDVLRLTSGRRVGTRPAPTVFGPDDAATVRAWVAAYRAEVAQPIRLAAKRLRAVSERSEVDDEADILDSVTGLETLYVGGDAAGELQYRLMIRIARFLRASRSDRVELAERVKKIYKLRSKIVHTGSVGKATPADVSELRNDSVALLRDSLRVFLRTPFHATKPEEMERRWLEFVLTAE